jgi:hypothetical protein
MLLPDAISATKGTKNIFPASIAGIGQEVYATMLTAAQASLVLPVILNYCP